MTRRLFLTLALLSLSIAVRGQTATLYGTVNEIVGDQYYPIAFAKVTLSGDQHATHPVVPDIEGKFALEAVPAGVYTLKVTAIGFSSLAREVELTAGDSVQVRIRLGEPDLAGIMVEQDDGYTSGQRLGGADR